MIFPPETKYGPNRLAAKTKTSEKFGLTTAVFSKKTKLHNCFKDFRFFKEFHFFSKNVCILAVARSIRPRPASCALVGVDAATADSAPELVGVDAATADSAK